MSGIKKNCKIEMQKWRHLNARDSLRLKTKKRQKRKSFKSDKYIVQARNLTSTTSTRLMQTKWSRCRKSARIRRKPSLANKKNQILTLQWSTRILERLLRQEAMPIWRVPDRRKRQWLSTSLKLSPNTRCRFKSTAQWKHQSFPTHSPSYLQMTPKVFPRIWGAVSSTFNSQYAQVSREWKITRTSKLLRNLSITSREIRHPD